MFSAKRLWKSPTLRFVTECSGIFLNRLMQRDLDCLRHNRGLDPAESPVNTGGLVDTNPANFVEASSLVNYRVARRPCGRPPSSPPPLLGASPLRTGRES